MAADLKRIAVIGSGVSGLTSAKYLKSAGSEVVVYERSSTLGGIWLEVPLSCGLNQADDFQDL